MNVLSLFDFTGDIKNEFVRSGHNAISLNIIDNPENLSVDIIEDFLYWDYKTYAPGYFGFIFIAFPCTTFSKASGGFHFKNNIPQTVLAHNSINLILKLKIVLDHFACPFLLENPTSAIGKSHYFKILGNLEYSRLTMANFGYPTRKQTDFYYNFSMLLLSPVTYRVNKQYQKTKFSNLSDRQRVSYPSSLVSYLVENILLNIETK